jgi:hypothetical protein
MTQAKMTLEEIRRSDPFISEDTQIDLSAYPWLTPLADTPVGDEKFAPVDTRGMGVGSFALKKFLTNPDRESIAELRNPELLKKFDEGHSGTVVHANGIPFQVIERGGRWHAKGIVDGQMHRFVADTREELFPKLTRVAFENAIRELTPDEELHIHRLAQSGDESAAFGQYFLSRIGPQVASMDDPLTELLSDPKYRNVCDEAAFFIWAAQTDAYVPDPEFEERVARVAESKPLSGRLITSIWIEHLDARQKKDRSALLGQLQVPEPEVADPQAIRRSLEDASDGDIERIMRDTTRHYAKEVRAGRL